MKTEQLIGMLAADVPAIDPHGVRRRYALALSVGALAAAVVMFIVIGGIRADIAQAAHVRMFWIKFAFPLMIVAAALVAVNRLGRPGVKLGYAPAALLLPIVLMWLLAAAALGQAAPGERGQLIFGVTWKECSLSIAAVAAPVFIAALWAMKGLAPTRPVAAGAVSGLLAGAVSATVYSFHCPEMAAPFIGTWYLLGMLVPAAAGALLGPRLLRW